MVRQAFWCACFIVLILSLPPTGEADLIDFSGFWDKLRLSMSFGGLTVLGLIAYPERPRALVIGLAALGVLIELTQSFAPWQYADFSDLLAILTGITVVRVVWAVSFRR